MSAGHGADRVQPLGDRGQQQQDQLITVILMVATSA